MISGRCGAARAPATASRWPDHAIRNRCGKATLAMAAFDGFFAIATSDAVWGSQRGAGGQVRSESLDRLYLDWKGWALANGVWAGSEEEFSKNLGAAFRDQIHPSSIFPRSTDWGWPSDYGSWNISEDTAIVGRMAQDGTSGQILRP